MPDVARIDRDLGLIMADAAVLEGPPVEVAAAVSPTLKSDELRAHPRDPEGERDQRDPR
jgi:hypothetical protein